MATAILHALGGVGLFLLGMLVMTEGLRAITGDALRRFLARFTRNPVTGVLTGAVTTAVVQSSSATTVAAVGFVGAGLLSFTQAVGIVFGANIGTTVTGWLVALVGLKLELSVVLLPLILVGVLMRMFGRTTVASAGQALAGFGLIFVGIDSLQGGMAGLQGVLTPDSFPADGLGGRLLLVGSGLVLTVVTQSSSAGVAMALAAVHAGTIGFGQAAALVIGMDIGTTVTAALAATGGSLPARRTAVAHVIYNLLTGTLAFAMLTPYMRIWEAAAPHTFAADPEIALAAFHSTFNVLAVLLILPFTGRFSSMIVRLVRKRGSDLDGHLDRSLLSEPAVAISALRITLESSTVRIAKRLVALLDGTARGHRGEQELEAVERVLGEAREYAGGLTTDRVRRRTHQRHAAILHAIDHLERLIDRVRKGARIATLRGDPDLQALVAPLRAPLGGLAAIGDPPVGMPPAGGLHEQWQHLAEQERAYRARTIERLTVDALPTEDALARLDAIRWLRRVAHHLWRILLHLERSHLGAGGGGLRPYRPADELDED